jgi:CBS domain containing-hemolysin-like protein
MAAGLLTLWQFALAQDAMPTASPSASPSPLASPSPDPTATKAAPVAFDLPAILTAVGGSLAAVFLLTLLTGIFSMAETAISSLRRSRVEQMAEEGRKGAKALKVLVENPPRYIATVQIGITLLSFASVAVAVAATTLTDTIISGVASAMDWEQKTAGVVVIGVTTFLVALLSMALGEIAPKSLALQAPDAWALRLAPFVNAAAFLFAPITALVLGVSSLLTSPFGAKARFERPMITREEVEQIIGQGEQHGELDDEEAKIMTNVIDLSETPVRAVMTPRIDMTSLSVDATLAKTLETILDSGHSRIPVYENTIDNVVGIVHAKDLLPLFQADTRDVDLRQVMRPPYFVPEMKKVSELLGEMRRSNHHLAIVQDEYAGTEGLVSIEDLLEEIVGEIRDEYDVDEPDIQTLSQSETLIDARMSIDDVNDRLGLNLPHKDYDTLGGLVFGLLGHEPTAGESVRVNGMEFTVESIEGRRIRNIRAVRVGDEAMERELVEAESGV